MFKVIHGVNGFAFRTVGVDILFVMRLVVIRFGGVWGPLTSSLPVCQEMEA